MGQAVAPSCCRLLSADDKERIHQVADELQAPPLLGKAMGDAGEQSEDEGTADEDEPGEDDDHDKGSCAEDSGGDDDQPRRRGLRVDHHSTSTDPDDNSSSVSQHVNNCSVCEAEPKRMEQVWNLSCRHGFCGDCMLARLSQRERRCMYCRAKIMQEVDASGNVFQHYDWARWWKERRQQLVSR